ncbi:MAG: hypothetical protein U1D67_08565, partial [Dehalococcoidia bacterium]|nr:hypothetical protein [Dehalococcoidia bacterium]
QIEFQISDPVTSQLYGNPLPFRINVERIVAGLELPSGANQVIAGETIFLSLYLEKVYQPVKEGKINLYFADRGGRVISFSPPRNDAVREPDRPDPVQNIGIVRFLDLKPVPDGGKIKLIDVAVELQAEPGILNPDIRVEKMETSDGEPLNTRLIKPFVAIYPAPTPTPTPKPSPTPVPATPTPSPSPSPTPTFSPAPPPSPAFTGGAMPGQVSTPFPAEPLTPVLTTPSPVKAPAQVPQEGFRSRYLSRITLAVILLLINIVLIRISK